MIDQAYSIFGHNYLSWARAAETAEATTRSRDRGSGGP
ncbi:hypothetical protein SBA3_800004 [Candidatus Sulfopaludibacter sp. SbA3]|nr:hypothetical protein SBA3_800004 [Candidatus Sulfopaludibacter sp. SbA3]